MDRGAAGAGGRETVIIAAACANGPWAVTASRTKLAGTSPTNFTIAGWFRYCRGVGEPPPWDRALSGIG